MDFKTTKKTIIDFAKEVVRLAKKNATKHKASGKLKSSISYKANVSENSFQLDFLMLKYGLYQDAGVDGVKKKHGSRKYKLPTYKYKRKGNASSLKGMPPPSVFDKWVIRKGLKDIRDEKGRFINRKSLTFLIAKSVFEKGLKPTYFFTDAFEKAYKKLPKDFIEAYALDAGNFLEYTLNNNE